MALIDEELLIELVSRFPERKVVVVGDLIADQFIYGEISRVSREAPVLILRHEYTETTPGGAANCAVNLAALGTRCSLVGFVGEDEVGRELITKLEVAGVNCSGIISVPSRSTPTKVRILAGQAHSPRQQVIRVDYERESTPHNPSEKLLEERLSAEIETADAVIISDYNYGAVNERVTDKLRQEINARERQQSGALPVLVDSRFRLTQFVGFTSATPNEAEVEHLARRRIDNRETLEEAARELRRRLECRALLVTRGGNGMLLMEEGSEEEPLYIQAVGSSIPVDVTGAGDTVIATYTAALSLGASFPEAAHLANYAGSVVVMKRGTASVSNHELLGALRH